MFTLLLKPLSLIAKYRIYFQIRLNEFYDYAHGIITFRQVAQVAQPKVRALLNQLKKELRILKPGNSIIFLFLVPSLQKGDRKCLSRFFECREYRFDLMEHQDLHAVARRFIILLEFQHFWNLQW